MTHCLITGGLGYIGSHTCVELLAAGHRVRIVDNLSNSKLAVLDCIAEISGQRPAFIRADIRDRVAMRAALAGCDAVIHFAGLKAVGESVEKPLLYYRNNVEGSIALFEAMAETGVKTIVFFSSATVYGDPASVPIREDAPLSATNPYGRSKLMIEDILRDVARADPGWKIALLRYFNPVGAHASGRIGEDPNGIPNNLMPYVAQVAVGKLPRLSVFGNDYPTPDGSGARLHPRRRSRQGSPRGTGGAGSARRAADGQSRYRPHLFGAGDGESLRNRQRQAGALSDRPALGGRHRHLLCRSGPGRHPAWLACGEGIGGYVPGCLALAEPESGWVSGLTVTPASSGTPW